MTFGLVIIVIMILVSLCLLFSGIFCRIHNDEGAILIGAILLFISLAAIPIRQGGIDEAKRDQQFIEDYQKCLDSGYNSTIIEDITLCVIPE